MYCVPLRLQFRAMSIAVSPFGPTLVSLKVPDATLLHPQFELGTVMCTSSAVILRHGTSGKHCSTPAHRIGSNTALKSPSNQYFQLGNKNPARVGSWEFELRSGFHFLARVSVQGPDCRWEGDGAVLDARARPAVGALSRWCPRCDGRPALPLHYSTVRPHDRMADVRPRGRAGY